MNEQFLEWVKSKYGWEDAHFEPVQSGLINHTYKVSVENKHYLFQEINHHVFKKPEQIDENLRNLSAYLKRTDPAYLFTAPVSTKAGTTLLQKQGKYYRVFEWIEGSHTLDVVSNKEQAYEAAKQFGLFTSKLKGFDASILHPTIPDFHNLSLRYDQFLSSIKNGNEERITKAKDQINYLIDKQSIVIKFEAFISHPDAKQRVTHHDTKISNVLFNNEQKGICVIDLDTVMPGYFISDIGDMIRTYVCPVSEEEQDLSLINIRIDYLEAIRQGYISEMQNDLSNFEMDHFYFAGEMIIYMQALRFFTDYLNNDIYYGSRYPEHNLYRTKNQIQLLDALKIVNNSYN